MNNLLPVILTDKEMLDKLGNDGKGKLKYNMMEGGYMSNDGAVCLVLKRSPYEGMLIPMKENDDKTNKLWAKYVCKLFGYKYEDKEVSATVEAEPTSIIPEEPELEQAIPTPPEASTPTASNNPNPTPAPIVNASNVKINTTKDPIVLGDTTGLPNDVWLEWRKHGPKGDIKYTLGGSDIAVVFGVSPWKTPLELWMEKHGDIPVKKQDNELQLEMGHLLEPISAHLFSRVTGQYVYEDKNLYQHPDYPWALANIDRRYYTEDGEDAILECKCTSFYKREDWDEDKYPYYYELQLRFYMAVLNINKGAFACFWGNNPDNDFKHPTIERDLEIEKEIFERCQAFIDSLYEGVPPTMEGVKSETAIKALQRIYEKGDKALPTLEFGAKKGKLIKKISENDMKVKLLKKEIDEIETESEELKVKIIEEMKEHEAATYTEPDGTVYTAKYPTRSRTTVDSKRLKEEEPDIYKEYQKTTYSRTFSVKVTEPKKV